MSQKSVKNLAEFINTAEFLERVPISRQTLFNWRREGVIPWVDIGGKPLFHWPSCEQAMLRRQRGGLQ